VSVLLGKGDGTFQTPLSFSAGVSPTAVIVADLNGDGKPDLAVSDYGDTSGYSQGVSLLLGNGDGTFGNPVTYTSGVGPHGVAAARFNGASAPLDLAVANFGNGSVSVFVGNGNGTLVAPPTFPVGSFPTGAAVGDLNGDGSQDVAVSNYNSGTVSVLLGNGNGTLQAALNFSAGSFTHGGGPRAIAEGDVNGDGKSDLVVANVLAAGSTKSGTLTVLLGNGDGTFQAPVNYNAQRNPWDVVLADFNGDGKLDAAVANKSSSTVTVFLNQGSGTFAAGVSYTAGADPESLVAGDFNSDGKPDLAVANPGSTGSVFVLLGNGDGTFHAGANILVQADAVVAGDFLGNGKLDLATVDQTTNVQVLLGNGDGSFQSPMNFATAFAVDSLTVGDFNGNNRLSIAAADSVFNGVTVFERGNSGQLLRTDTYFAGMAPHFVVAASLNDDHAPDLVTANLNGVSLLLNTLPDFQGPLLPASAMAPADQAKTDITSPHRQAAGDTVRSPIMAVPWSPTDGSAPGRDDSAAMQGSLKGQDLGGFFEPAVAAALDWVRSVDEMFVHDPWADPLSRRAY
jgi:hypothetical protein